MDKVFKEGQKRLDEELDIVRIVSSLRTLKAMMKGKVNQARMLEITHEK